MNTNINDILALVEQLSDNKKTKLVNQIMTMLEQPVKNDGCASIVKEFAGDRPDCPHCSAKAYLGLIVKNGKKNNGAPSYICKNCGKW